MSVEPNPNPYVAGQNPYDSTDPQVYDPSTGPQPVVTLPPEKVVPGLALALLAVPAGAGAAAIIGHLGFIASISTFLMAALAAFLYRKGSGGQIRRGIPGLAGIIVLGAVVSFFAVVAVDLSDYYSKASPQEVSELGTRGEFIGANLFYGPVLAEYKKTAGLFALFAALGAFSVIRRLIQANRAR